MKRFARPKWIVVGGLLLALGAWGVHQITAPRKRLAHYRAALEKRGFRLSLDDLVPTVAPAHLTAARKFTAAAQSLPRDGEVMPLNPPAVMHSAAPGKASIGWKAPFLVVPGRDRNSRRTNRWEELAEDLRRARPQLDQIREASLAPAFDWALDYRQGFSLLPPQLASSKQASQWLTAQTQLALHEHRLDDALELLETQLRLVRNLRDDGLLINQLVRIAMASITFGSTWEALQAEGWTDSQLARLQAAWGDVEFVKAMIGAMELERALGLQEYARIRQSPAQMQSLISAVGAGGGGGLTGTSSDGLVSRALDWIGGSARNTGWSVRALVWAKFESWDDERCYIEMIQTMIEEAGSRLSNATAAGQPLPMPSPGDPSAELKGHLLAGTIVPSLARSFEKAYRMQAQREMARAAIALNRYRIRHGVWPERLDQLVPEWLDTLPADWMDGRPLRYQAEGDGRYKLYSVNTDGRDDGGDPRPVFEKSHNTSPYVGRDFVWPQPATEEDVVQQGT